MKQALMKQRFGKEVGTSAEAKASLERDEKYYVVALGGVRMPFGGGRGQGRGPGGDAKGGGNPMDAMKQMLMNASLSVKGKDKPAPNSTITATCTATTFVLLDKPAPPKPGAQPAKKAA